MIVFIGTKLAEAAIRAALDSCLVGSVTTARFDPARYAGLPDPFPSWDREAA